jgi:hypothetical protein
MKTGLWVVIVLVTGIVGFLVGYSVSSFTGVRKLGATQHAAETAKAAPAHAAPAASAGYGGAAPAAAPASAGYGAPAPTPAAKPPVKPAAAGY